MSRNFDIEDIWTSVFKDSFPESWRDNADFAEYISELSSYGVDKLSIEPDRIAEERKSILEQTQDLAFHNYKTFIQTADCSKEIFQDFQIIESHVGSMLQKLPVLSEECGQFMTKAQEINVNRRMNSLTLQRHTQLLEILEIPQLMDTCVRNNYYDEALELASHVYRLEKKHASIPVIATIVNEVKQSTQFMLNALVNQLRSNIQLPACLRVIGYLRRMDAFTEPELRIKFLQARDTWFKSILDAIPKDDPYHHITKTIEASRVHLFDIITQYRAIFSDEDPLISTGNNDSLTEGALFHGWVVQKVSQFLSTLEVDLEKGVSGRLDSVLGQCMYFGLSFSRVGADFRGLLTPVFQKAALRSFTTTIDHADSKFDEAMQSFTLLGGPPTLPSSALSLASAGSGTLHPSMSLIEFPPLAHYCNNVLAAFNELRLCAPLSLAGNIACALQGSLQQAAQAVLAYHRAEEATFNAQERGRFADFVQVFCDALVPHFNKCLQTIFPPSQISQALGISAIDLLKIGNLGMVDVKQVIALVQHLMPPKMEEPEPVAFTGPVDTNDQSEASTGDVLETKDVVEIEDDIVTENDVETENVIETETVIETVSEGDSEPSTDNMSQAESSTELVDQSQPSEDVNQVETSEHVSADVDNAPVGVHEDITPTHAAVSVEEEQDVNATGKQAEMKEESQPSDSHT